MESSDDRFDFRMYLPDEIEPDWFDVVPLIKTNYGLSGLIRERINPGINTISCRKGFHQLFMLEILNHKIHVSPWLNTTLTILEYNYDKVEF